MAVTSTRTAHPVLLILAFLAVYLIWGSTYLAIRFAISTIPPFLMGGLRFLTAGTLVYLFTSWRHPAPSVEHWRSAIVLGTLMLFIGNGCVVWAEQHISSSVAALLITTEPLWIVLLQWLALGGEMPSTAIWFGLFVGTIGAILLVGDGLFSEGLHIDYAGVAAVIAATLAWAIGSLYVRRASWPASALQATSMQMLVGGLLQLATGTLRGASGRSFRWRMLLGRRGLPWAISLSSVLSWLILLTIGWRVLHRPVVLPPTLM